MSRVYAALILAVIAVGCCAGSAYAAAGRAECQRPVKTGVQVSDLSGVSVARACPVALALFRWEYSSEAHTRSLYGCRRDRRTEAGYPYLKLREFAGWNLSLRGHPYGAFTMSRGSQSFEVSGTDFPLNCT